MSPFRKAFVLLLFSIPTLAALCIVTIVSCTMKSGDIFCVGVAVALTIGMMTGIAAMLMFD